MTVTPTTPDCAPDDAQPSAEALREARAMAEDLWCTTYLEDIASKVALALDRFRAAGVREERAAATRRAFEDAIAEAEIKAGQVAEAPRREDREGYKMNDGLDGPQIVCCACGSERLVRMAPPLCARCDPSAPIGIDEQQKVCGVFRFKDNARTLLIALSERPTDDEIRSLHEFLRGWRR